MIEEPDLTESERFMASYIQNVCNRPVCNIHEGICYECMKKLKRAGKCLDEFIINHNKQQFDKFIKDLPKIDRKNSKVKIAWNNKMKEE